MSLVNVVVADNNDNTEGQGLSPSAAVAVVRDRPKRVSTLTYPSFGGGVLTFSPTKNSPKAKTKTAARISELSELTSSHSHNLIFQDSSGSMQSQLLFDDSCQTMEHDDDVENDDDEEDDDHVMNVVDEENIDQSSDDVDEDNDDDEDYYDDLNEPPRQLEIIHSVDGSDVTNSYGTITTSSSSSTVPPPISPRKTRSLARRGTMGGESACLPAAQPIRRNCHSMSSFPDLVDDGMDDNQQPQGPFLSPQRDMNHRVTIPGTPLQDSNPLLFPKNLSYRADTSQNHESEQSLSFAPTNKKSPVGERSKQTNWHDSSAGPFVSPRSIPRSFHPAPETPQQDSNPLLYPKGLSFYPLIAPLANDDDDQDTAAPVSARKIASEPPHQNDDSRQTRCEMPLSSRHLSSPVRHLDNIPILKWRSIYRLTTGLLILTCTHRLICPI